MIVGVSLDLKWRQQKLNSTLNLEKQAHIMMKLSLGRNKNKKLFEIFVCEIFSGIYHPQALQGQVICD